MNENEEIWHLFRAEGGELLQKLETILLEMESAGEPDAESINALFRAAHTLKGTAGMAEFEHVVAFAHIVESLLEDARNERITITKEIISTLLACRDHLGELWEHALNKTEPDINARVFEERLRRKLLEHLAAGGSELKAMPESSQAAATDLPATARDESQAVASPNWHISLRFGPNAYRNGLDPIPLLSYLKKIGSIKNLVTVTAALPDQDVDPESCYLGFEIQYASTESLEEIDKAFEFVRFDCEITILPPGAPLASFVELIGALPESEERAGELLLAAGALTAEELAAARETTGVDLPEHLPIADAIQASQAGASRQGKAASFLRIETGKLDNLINLVGELAISAVNLTQTATKSHDPELLEQSAIMNRLIGEARDSALKLRMVQVGDTFRRFRRFVREVGRELDKDIRLNIQGGETELDKTVVEKIEDPLTHIIRNAIDHGIESSEERRANGKPLQGTLHLRAYQETGSFVIQIEDDGAGIDRERVLAKGLEKGLILDSNQNLNEEAVFDLLFQPGFSTAATVTNLSGRGVGLDVVKKEIEALRGSVTIRSEVGQGTTFTIRLPLTLAIIDGFLVGVGDTSCVVPLEQMVECISISDADKIDGRRDCIYLRGEVLPYIDLAELFGVDQNRTHKENIVVVQYGDLRCGLLVDDLFGEFQTIIKPLGKIFDQLKGIGGMSIMGGGGIAFILDIPALVQQVARREQKLYRSAAPSR